MLAFATPLAAGLRLGARSTPWPAATSVRRSLVVSAATRPVPDLVNAAIKDNRVMVFSKSRCPYCARAKALLREELDLDPTVWELDQMQNGSDIQEELLHVTGQRTVPNIFVNQQHIGGSEDLFDWYGSGKLQGLLESN